MDQLHSTGNFEVFCRDGHAKSLQGFEKKQWPNPLATCLNRVLDTLRQMVY
jgi:hypothetical protein